MENQKIEEATDSAFEDSEAATEAIKEFNGFVKEQMDTLFYLSGGFVADKKNGQWRLRKEYEL